MSLRKSERISQHTIDAIKSKFQASLHGHITTISMDEEVMLTRVNTFKEWKWFFKPHSLSAIECARKGWINSDTDELCCTICKVRLLCPITLTDDEELQRSFVEQLSSAHLKHCIWSSYEIPATCCDFPIISHTNLYQIILNRIKNLVDIPFFPKICQKDIIADAVHNHSLLVRKIHPKLGDVEIESILSLVLCGWEWNSSTQRLGCSFCSRETQPEYYLSVNDSVKEQSDFSSSNTSSRVSHFDPVEEHFFYCAWFHKNPSSPNAVLGVHLAIDALNKNHLT